MGVRRELARRKLGRVPDRGAAVGSLFGIAATSSSDIWAVGDRIEHWDGRRWTVEPSPKLPAHRGLHQSLSAKATVSPSEAWAVGGSTIEGYRCRG
jgi:hypothetical protein